MAGSARRGSACRIEVCRGSSGPIRLRKDVFAACRDWKLRICRHFLSGEDWEDSRLNPHVYEGDLRGKEYAKEPAATLRSLCEVLSIQPDTFESV